MLEQATGKRWKHDFNVGYSPERITPGDRKRRLTKIVKVVSGDTPETLDKVAARYEMIVEPGVRRCSSIKAAEACKVIENTQRNLNIALIDELAIIFDKIGLDTSAVLEAAGTKWSMAKFKPGLVGGHCIGSRSALPDLQGPDARLIPAGSLAGRRINEGMVSSSPSRQFSR